MVHRFSWLLKCLSFFLLMAIALSDVRLMAQSAYPNADKEILAPLKKMADSLWTASGNILSPKDAADFLKKDTTGLTYPVKPRIATGKGEELSANAIYAKDKPAVGLVAMCSKPSPLHEAAINPASAFVITPDGICVTNYHVIYAYANTQTISGKGVFLVRLGNGKVYALKAILAASAADDIALIQLDTHGETLPFLPLSERDAEIGDEAYVLGNPLGQVYSFTRGMVSNRYNDLIAFPGGGGGAARNLMSITADFAVGSSGSPILDNKGNVIGIVSSTHIIEQSHDGYRLTQMVVKNTIPVSSIKKLIRSVDGDKELVELYKGLLELIYKGHYAPPEINDSLSLHLFNGFLKSLDPDKDIFLQSDLDALAVFKYTIDDEMKGVNPLAFYTTVKSIYQERLQELNQLSLLAPNGRWEPLKSKERIAASDSLQWPATPQERTNRWNKLLTYQYLSRCLDFEKGYPLEKERRSKAILSLAKKYGHWLNANTTGLDETSFFAGYVNVFCMILDPHTEYQPPVSKRKFDQQMSNAFYGIGVHLAFNDQKDVVIRSVMSGMAAWKTGKVTDGSMLLSVGEGKVGPWLEVDGLALPEIVDKIRGAEGSTVRLRIKDEKTGNIHEVAMQREKVSLLQAAARSAIIERPDGKRIGILYLPEFYNDFAHPDGARSAADVAIELDSLNKAHIDALFVDLRNNGGGSLSDVVKIAGYFIPAGPIVQLRDRTGQVYAMTDNDTVVQYNGPLGILINGFSASASEILAAAMQDYKRAIIIGTPSYGKGTVQRQLPLGKYEGGESQYGALKLTFEKFYRINGSTTQRTGITPDVFLPDAYNYFHLRERDQPTALTSDTVTPASYAIYQGGTAAVMHTRPRLDYKGDTELKRLDALAKEIAEPLSMYTDLAAIRKQYESNKQRFDRIRSLETLKKEDAMKIIPVGKYQDQDWYKEWLKNLTTSRYLLDAQTILLAK